MHYNSSYFALFFARNINTKKHQNINGDLFLFSKGKIFSLKNPDPNPPPTLDCCITCSVSWHSPHLPRGLDCLSLSPPLSARLRCTEQFPTLGSAALIIGGLLFGPGNSTQIKKGEPGRVALCTGHRQQGRRLWLAPWHLHCAACSRARRRCRQGPRWHSFSRAW